MLETEKKTKLVLKLTGRCNLACSYCYGKRTENVGEQPLLLDSAFQDSVDRVLEEKREEIVDIVFFGGEPLIEIKAMVEIVRRLKNRNVHFSINTNGTLVDKNIAEWLAGNGFSISISIDGRLKDNDLNRKTDSEAGSYNKVIKALTCLRETGGNDWFSRHVAARMTIVPETIQRLERNIAHIRELGIENAGFAFDSTAFWDRRHLEILKDTVNTLTLDYLNGSGKLPKIADFERVLEGKITDCRPGVDTITIDRYGRRFGCHRTDEIARILKSDTCNDCAAVSHCTMCTVRMGLKRPNATCEIKLMMIPAFEQLQKSRKNLYKNIIMNSERRNGMEKYTMIDGELYRIPQEVLEKYKIDKKECADKKPRQRLKSGQTEPPIKGNWYELGESDCF